VRWNRIVIDHGEMLYRAAYRILHDNGDAEDVVQDVLLEAYRKHQENGAVPVGGLLRRMVTFRAIDRLRRRRRAEPIEDATIAGFGEAPDRAIQREEQVDLLRHAIGRLPQREAECFLLRYVEGMSNEEIAKTLGTNSSVISTALHRARAKLREAMNSRTGSEMSP
jgi:RNA polymerase sigma-70 factor (ECF subfamily)